MWFANKAANVNIGQGLGPISATIALAIAIQTRQACSRDGFARGPGPILRYIPGGS
jgi:hypothetical protein